MIIVLRPDATEKDIDHLIKKVEGLGLKPKVSKGVGRTIIGVIGEEDILRVQPLEAYPGVERVIPVLAPYKLVSREFKPDSTVVDIGGVKLGGSQVVVIAGPCAVEGKELLLKIAGNVKTAGARILRAGAFKPRTSPYSFQGLGEEGLEYLKAAREKTGLPFVTEAMDTRQVKLVGNFADAIQIGARNMQNFGLLREVGRSKKPVVLKRGMMATVRELLMAAEYLLSEGNFDVVLCERGIRTFEDATRNTVDISAVPLIKKLSHLPVIVDPSHGTGRWDLITPLSKAAIAAGADGLLIEVHSQPEEALSDGAQSLRPEKFADLMKEIALVAKAVGRDI